MPAGPPSFLPISSSRPRPRATRTRSWPSRANSFASSRPIPLEAPVTRTLPARAVTVPGLPRLEGVGEHPRVEAIPVALEPFLWIVLALQLQEVDELRVAGLDLRPRRPVMVGQVIAAAVLDRTVDEAAEVARRLLDRPGIV